MTRIGNTVPHMPVAILRRRSVHAAAVLIVVLLVAALGAYYWTQRGDESRAVAIVNEDTPVTDAGKPLAAGGEIVTALQGSPDFEWEVVSSDQASSGKYLAAVTIPSDFSSSVMSLSTATPRQAHLTVSYQGDGSPGDKESMDTLFATVSDKTGANGIKGLLSNMTTVRSQLQQTLTTAQLLAAGTNAAEGQMQQALAGADQLLPYLETARAGANQLVDVAGQVSHVVDGVAPSVTELSDRLTKLGVTIGDVSRGSSNAQRDIDTAIALLKSSGLPVGDTITTLTQTRDDLGLASRQLSEITGVLGPGTGPDTDLGTALRSGLDQLQSVSAQLSSAGGLLQEGVGPIADQAPQLLGGGKDQIIAAVTQLKNLSKSIADQLGKGVTAIPIRTPAQQEQVSTVLSAPVAVDQTDTPASVNIFTASNLAILFGITTLLFAAALLWALRRRPAGSRE